MPVKPVRCCNPVGFGAAASWVGQPRLDLLLEMTWFGGGRVYLQCSEHESRDPKFTPRGRDVHLRATQ
jgi:hypothetical protein